MYDGGVTKEEYLAEIYRLTRLKGVSKSCEARSRLCPDCQDFQGCLWLSALVATRKLRGVAVSSFLLLRQDPKYQRRCSYRDEVIK